jgi:CotH protein/lamin tail-like protein/Ig-like domain-containing protein
MLNVGQALPRKFSYYAMVVSACALLGISLSTYAAAGPPVITGQPASATVLQGGSVTFSVVVDGTAPFTYQWFQGASPIGGATSASYMISGLQASHEGFYSVAVTNALGNATSASAELVVDPGLLIVQTNALVLATNLWRYNQTDNLDAANWKSPAYDDTIWPQGLASLYVEDAALPVPKNTALTIGRNTYYFRANFSFTNANYVSLALATTVLIDDGAVFYLNGQEGFRIGMNAGTPTYNIVANRTTGDAVLEGPFDFPATNLLAGPNVLAAEVHQSGAASTDIVLSMALDALVTYRVDDTAPPTILGASGTTNNTVLVFFSERVDPATATNSANYMINNGIGVLSAAFTNDASTIVLQTTTLTNEASYIVTVNNVRDRAVNPNPITPDTQQPFTVAASVLTTVDIGGPSVPAVFTPVPGGFDLTASGTNIFGNADQFSYSFMSTAQDFDLQVRVAGLNLSDAWAKAGIMARETTQAGSRYAGIFATPSVAGTFFQSRLALNGPTTASGNFPVSYPETWLRLRRVGDVFTGFASVDGQNWTQVGTATLGSAVRPILVGLAGVSATPSGTTVAQFRDFGTSIGGTIGGVTLPIEPLGPSSRKTGLIISEIMYHPKGSNDAEFIELFNADYIAQDLSGFRLSGAIEYTFPASTILPAGAFLVIARNPGRLESLYGLSGVLGPWLGEDGSAITNALPDDNGRVRLRNRGDAVILEVNYEGHLPWPIAADGAGHSLVLTRPSYGEDDVRAWAASAHIGGSPGRMDPAPLDRIGNVVINEFLANSPVPLEDFIELYNHGKTAVDLSGAWLSDDRDTNRFRIPNGTVLAPRGFVYFTEGTLGFSLSSGGERIYLVNSNQTRVVDVHAFEGQATAVSSGHYPDGAPEFQELATRTPGAANSPPLARSIVINEIMYNPVSNDSDDEYVELYNRTGVPVDVGNWRFTAGIDYTIPNGAVIAGNGYLVIARDAVGLRAKHPHLNATNALGDFDGSLANGGERLALSMPEYFTTTNGNTITTNAIYIVVDEVPYQDGGRWGRWSDGGGSSLELIDPDSDNRLAPNWADSNEAGKAPWTDVEFTGNLNNGPNSPSLANSHSELHLMILGAGECLVDNVEVIPAGNTNRVGNSQFASSTNGWLVQGNHVRSTYSPVSFDGVGGSLHMKATSGGDNGVNRVEVDLALPLINTGVCTIRAKVRWLAGHTNVLLRLYGNYLEAVGDLRLPTNLGTPGLPNSRAVPNAGPAIVGVVHSPILPAAGQPVTVTARISDPDGLGALSLRYRRDPSGTFDPNVTMVDNGLGSDAVAGDGLYTGVIPGQANGTLVAFHISATDGAGATATFPNDVPTRECHVRFGDPTPFGTFGSYRLWLTAANISRWTAREKLSNEPLDSTFVYGNFRVVYNAGGRYRGSPWIRPGYNGPTGGRCAYVWTVPDDDLVLGADELNLDSLEPSDRDPTALREVTSFWMAEQLGIPFSNQRFVHVTINGVNNTSRGIPIYTDSQQPDSGYVESWFADDPDGEIFKVDDWFEFTDTTDPGKEGWNENGRMLNYTTTLTNGMVVKNKTRYRWSWEKKFNGVLNDDYSSIFQLADAMSARDSAYAQGVEAIIDLEEWLTAQALRHIIGDWDGYGYDRGKNQFIYKTKNGKWQMLLWDLDFSLGCQGGHGTSQNLFQVEGGEANVAFMYNHPHTRRIYFRALQRAVDGPLVDANARAAIDARYRAMQANQVTAISPYANSGAQNIPIPTWIAQRRTYIISQIPVATFAVTSGASVTTSNGLVIVTGNAPISIATVRVNGQLYPVTWTGVTAWSLRLAVAANTNLDIQGFDAAGNPITPVQTVNVNYTGPSVSPEDTLVFNEIMYNPVIPNASYVEILNRSTTLSFDLSGWRVNGLDFTFPLGSVITNRQALLLARDRFAFAAAYGANLQVAGQFDGNLDSEGETLSLIKPGATPQDDLVIDRVRYEAGAPWAAGANGGSASLQLIDAQQDNARVSNWSDGVGWRFFSYTNNLSAGSNRFIMFIAAPAEIYIDDIALVAGTVPEAGINLIRNGDFEGPLLTTEGGPWSFFNPNAMSNTMISTTVKYGGTGSLKFVQTVGGATAYMYQDSVIVPATGQHTISFRYRPITNNTTLTVRVNALYQNAPNVRGIFSSPGAANPIAVSLPPYPPLWLNEVQPNNVSGIVDGSSTPEPWIELYNGGSNAVSLGGMFLSDNYGSNLTQWAFPLDATIASGEFKVIWADGDPEESTETEWHTSFRLPPSSGTLALTRLLGSAPQIVDYLTYNGVGPNLSYGDFPDGQPFNRRIFYTVTPGATNQAPSGAIFINEWLASNQNGLIDPADNDRDDWFELFNPNDFPIDLSGYYLSDTLTNKTHSRIPNGYTLPAHGYLLVWADNETGQNPSNRVDLHASFDLRRVGEDIALFAPDGTLVDSVTFTNHTTDVSEGRFPDGAPDRYFMTTTTPGTNNVVDGVNNTPPVLAPIANKYVTLGQSLSFTASASDSDIPAQTLTYSLINFPAGATIGSANGLFIWTPTPGQTPSTNAVTVRVQDNGVPALSDSETFTVYVVSPPRVSLSKVGGQVTLTFGAENGQQYQVEFTDTLGDEWQSLGDPVTATGLSITVNDTVGAQPQRFYRIRLVN